MKEKNRQAQNLFAKEQPIHIGEVKLDRKYKKRKQQYIQRCLKQEKKKTLVSSSAVAGKINSPPLSKIDDIDFPSNV